MRRLDRFGAVALYCLFSLAALRCTTSSASALPTLASDADGSAAVSGVAEHARANQDDAAVANVAVQVHSHKTSGDAALDGHVEWQRGATYDDDMRSLVVVGADGSVFGQNLDDAIAPMVRQQEMESQGLAHGASVEEDTGIRYATRSADDASNDPEWVRAIHPQQAEAQLSQDGSLGRPLKALYYSLLATTFYASNGGGGIAIAVTFVLLLIIGCITVFLVQRRHQKKSEALASQGENEPLCSSDVEADCSMRPSHTRTIPHKKRLVDFKVGEFVEVLSRKGGYRGESHWVQGRVASLQPDGSLKVDVKGKQTCISSDELVILVRHACESGVFGQEVGQVVEVYSGTHGWVQARISKVNKDGSLLVDYIGFDMQKTIVAKELPNRMRRIQTEGPIIEKDIVNNILHVLDQVLRIDAPGILAGKGWFLPVTKVMERPDMAGISTKELRTVVATSEMDSGQRLFEMRDGLHGAEVRHQETVLLAKLEYHASGVGDDVDWELERRLGILGKGALKGHTLTRTDKGEYDIDDCVATHVSMNIVGWSGEILVDRRGQPRELLPTLTEFLQELEPALQHRSRFLSELEWARRREAQALRESRLLKASRLVRASAACQRGGVGKTC